MKVIIDIPKKEYDIIKNYKSFMPWAEGLIKKGVAIPEGATNGDMIKAMFPQAVYNESLRYVVEMSMSIGKDMKFVTEFDKDWWNALYKKSEG